MAFCIWGRPHWIQGGKHFLLIFVFLAAGLVDLDREYLSHLNAQNTEKQWVKVLGVKVLP